jgi:hypothetical protein
MSRSEQQAMHEIMGSTLSRLGYDWTQRRAA